MNPRRNKAAFTLIELLVVIAIIAILASLLLPAISRAKAAGQLARCKSNEHQMLVGLTMYAQDAGAYPYFRSLGFVPGTPFVAWFQKLSPYLANAKWGDGVYKCPAYKWDSNVPRESANFAAGSYAYNGFGEGPTSQLFDNQINGGLSAWPSESPIKENMVRDPSGLYAIGDSVVVFHINWDNSIKKQNNGGADDYWPMSIITNTTDRISFMTQHPSGYNMGFLDGHVELVRADKLHSREAKYWRRWNRLGWAPENPNEF